MNQPLPSPINQDNLSDAVNSALLFCKSELKQAELQATNNALVQDLRVAVDALQLQLIDSEMRGGKSRPKHQKSGLFTRYVIDEDERMKIDPKLKDLIVKIEDVYARFF